MLKYYTEISRRPELNDIPLVPMIDGQARFRSLQNPAGASEAKYSAWWRMDQTKIKRVDPSEADVFILPYDWYWYRGPHWRSSKLKPFADAVAHANRSVYELARSVGKPMLLFFSGDRSHEPTPFDHALTFREGLYKSRSGPNDFCLPAFSEDLTKSPAYPSVNAIDEDIILRGKKELPTVGFCGFAPQPKKTDRIVECLYQALSLKRSHRFDVSPHAGERIRFAMLQHLTQSDAVEQNFILKDRSVFLEEPDQRKRQTARQQFIANMVDSDYVFCCRGSGNYSYRLYETLCLGRIPLIYETDNRYPFDQSVDWSELGVRVDEKNALSVGDIVNDHFRSMSAETYRIRQIAGRKFWTESLSPEGFFSKLADSFGD